MEMNCEVNFFCLDEDKVPTIHIKSYFGNCSIRIDKPEWVNNLDGEDKLNADGLECLIYILKENMEPEEFPSETQYSLARKIWNLNHWDCSVPKMNMPDYSSLPVKE